MNKVVVDCKTGEAKTIVMSPKEEKDFEAFRDRLNDKRNKVRDQMEAEAIENRKIIEKRAAVDPDFAALARLTGVIGKDIGGNIWDKQGQDADKEKEGGK